MNRSFSFVLAVIVAASCDTGGGIVDVKPDLPVQDGLRIEGYVDPLEEGANKGLKALAEYDIGPDKDVTAQAAWSSSETTVATVAMGTLSAVSSGSSQITASHGGFTATVQVVVNAKPIILVGIAIVGDSVFGRAGWYQYRCRGDYSNGDQKLLDGCTWFVQNPPDSVVGEGGANGRVYINRRGSFKVTATHGAHSATKGVLVPGTTRSQLPLTMRDTVWTIIMDNIRGGNESVIRQDSTVASVWIPSGVSKQDLDAAMAFWANEDPRIQFYQVQDSAGASLRYRFDAVGTVGVCAWGGLSGDIQLNPKYPACYDKETLAHEMGRWLGFLWDWKPDGSDIMSGRGVWKSDPLRTEVLRVLYSISPRTILVPG